MKRVITATAGTVGMLMLAGVGFVGGSAAFGFSGLATSDDERRPASQAQPAGPLSAPGSESADEFPVNENGETYGSAADAPSLADEPDLIQVVGNDGVRGFCKKVDLDGPTVRSPADAEAYMEDLEGRTIPVYDATGENVVDQFTIR